jgi:hypothetical protein
MNNEDIERNIEFIVNQQARSSSDLRRILKHSFGMKRLLPG